MRLSKARAAESQEALEEMRARGGVLVGDMLSNTMHFKGNSWDAPTKAMFAYAAHQKSGRQAMAVLSANMPVPSDSTLRRLVKDDSPDAEWLEGTSTEHVERFVERCSRKLRLQHILARNEEQAWPLDVVLSLYGTDLRVGAGCSACRPQRMVRVA